MMHGPEKSDPGIVAMKPANKTEQSVAEPVERRAGTKGNADQQSTCRTQSRISVSQALERIRKVQNRFAVTHPRWEPYAGKPHVRFCAGALSNERPYRVRWRRVNGIQLFEDAALRLEPDQRIEAFLADVLARAKNRMREPILDGAYCRLRYWYLK